MWVQRQAPFFSGSEGSVEEAGIEFDASSCLHVESKRFKDVVEDAASHPVLKATMAGLVRRIVLRQILPMRTGLEHPQDAFEDAAIVLTRAAAGFKALQRRNKGCDNIPLRVGDEHEERVSAPLLPRIGVD